MNRRSVLAWLSAALGAALGVALAAPAAALLTFPARRGVVAGGDEPIDVGSLDALPDGVPVRMAVRASRLRDAWAAARDVTLGAAWLRRDGERVRAWSTVCPHAGCAVDWNGAAARFECPCHDSAFAADGARAAGPAPRGLDPLDVTVEAGRVRVAWRRYRQGVPDREPT